MSQILQHGVLKSFILDAGLCCEFTLVPLLLGCEFILLLLGAGLFIDHRVFVALPISLTPFLVHWHMRNLGIFR